MGSARGVCSATPWSVARVCPVAQTWGCPFRGCAYDVRVEKAKRAVVTPVAGRPEEDTMQMRASGKEWLVGLAIVSSLAGLVPRAHAGIDASGPWYVLLRFTDTPSLELPCSADFVQSGDVLSAQFASSCSGLVATMTGTIDSATGAFTLSAQEAPVCGPGSKLSGTVAPGGSTFDGTFTCEMFSFLGVAQALGSRCGNGVLDPGETCDDGNREDADCCLADCTPAPAGNDCSFGNPCQASTCDGAGGCTLIPVDGPCDDYNSCSAGDTCVNGDCVGTMLPDGSACDDGDRCSTGDMCEDGYCYGPDPVDCGPCQRCDYFDGCVEGRSYTCSPYEPGRSTLRLHGDRQASRDTVQWKLVPEYGVSIGSLGDPRSTTSYDLCVFEEFGFGRLIAGLEVPAGGICDGKACWKPQRNGYAYSDKSGSSDGVRSVELQAGDPGKGKLVVKAKGPGMGLGTLPVQVPVTVQLQNSDGACWEADFFDAKQNSPIDFRAEYVTTE